MSLTDCRLRPYAMHDFEACIPLIAAQHRAGMKHITDISVIYPIGRTKAYF